jgi:beta-galactosidase
MTLTTRDNQFLLDGKPFRILSGAMHYFRIVPGYWRDRLEKLKAFGLNTVETYIAWNLHEPQPGDFRFDGMLDVVKFIQIAAELGLKVIIRPGPYICSEWDFGGLPYWLLKDPAMQVRCAYPPYLAAVDRYFYALLPRLAPLQSTHGGPIIAMQVENEYGSYGNDKVYLRYLVAGLRKCGIDAFLFTSDGPRDGCLQGGTLPEVFKTVNFAFNAGTALARLREYQPDGPLMVMEFWSGWYDHWGDTHHISADGSESIQRSVDTLDELLSLGASVNFYMFHGGTNFGFMNGANLDENTYNPAVTSYDYACLLDEAGDPSPRYTAYREILSKYVYLPSLSEIQPSKKAAYGPVAMAESAGLFDTLDNLSQAQASLTPPPMEMLEQDYGFALYRTRISGQCPEGQLHARDLHDRALVFLDGEYHATLERETGNESTSFAIPEQGVTVDLLVENMGRVNFGPGLIDRKGILGGVTFNDQFQFGWEVYPLTLHDLGRLNFNPLDGTPQTCPTFYRASFQVDQPADTFLALPGWTKGTVWLNGFNLGRYWARGPQQTLYVPAPLLKPGQNELIVFELHRVHAPRVEFRDKPDLG